MSQTRNGKIDCRPISWRGRSCKEVCTKECPYIHKPDENENNSDRRVRLGKLKDTSCLGEKRKLISRKLVDISNEPNTKLSPKEKAREWLIENHFDYGFPDVNVHKEFVKIVEKALDIALEEQAKQIVAELRSKNPYMLFVEPKKGHIYDGWDLCVDELERLLKEKK